MDGRRTVSVNQWSATSVTAWPPYLRAVHWMDLTPAVSYGVWLNRREAPTGVSVEAAVEPVVDPDNHHLPLTEERQFDQSLGGVIDAPRRLATASRHLDSSCENANQGSGFMR